MAVNDAVDWRADLGGGVTRRPRPGGHVPVRRRDAVRAGAADPVGSPRRPTRSTPSTGSSRRSTACSIETPAGRVLVETGIGERVDEKTRDDARLRGAGDRAGARRTPASTRRSIDVVAMSHLHFDHAGGLLARRRRARLPAGDDRRPAGRVGDRPQRQRRGSWRRYVQPELRLVRDWGARGLGRRRARDPAGRERRPDRRPLGRPPGDRRPRSRGRRADPGVLRRPADAAVERQSALGHRVRRLPARLGRPQGRALRARPPTRTGSSSCRTRRSTRSAASSATATASGSRPDVDAVTGDRARARRRRCRTRRSDAGRRRQDRLDLGIGAGLVER